MATLKLCGVPPSLVLSWFSLGRSSMGCRNHRQVPLVLYISPLRQILDFPPHLSAGIPHYAYVDIPLRNPPTFEVGLVQPIANWAKHTGVGGEAWANVSEVGGLRFRRLPGHREVIAQEYKTHRHLSEPSLPAHPHLQIIVPTARVQHLVQLAFFIPHPPPVADTHAPPLSQRDISAVTISLGKGSDNPY